MRFTFSIHIPLFRGDDISVTVFRHGERTLEVIMFREIADRDFHEGIMPYIGGLATEIAKRVGKAWIDCFLVFSGRGYQPDGYHALLAGRWPAQSYALATVTNGASTAEHDKLDGSGGDPVLGLPCNHYVVPRIVIIGCLNLAYSQPGLLTISAGGAERDMVEAQLADFAERANKVSTNDPEALLEYQGEGLVMAWGVGVWYAFRGDILRNEWSQRWKAGDQSRVLAST